MYLYLIICGFLFVTASSIVLTYLFEMFSINGFTKFLNPLENSTFNRIGISVMPNIIWAFIEAIVVSSNKFFIVGFFLNLFITLSISYVIKYGYELINSEEGDILKISAIIFSVFFGFICNYLCLLIGVNKYINPFATILILIAFTAIYLIVRFYPPKIEFFRGVQE